MQRDSPAGRRLAVKEFYESAGGVTGVATFSANQFGSFRRPIYKTILVLFLLLSQKITEGVDVVAKTFCEFAPYGTNFSHHRVIGCTGHGASNSSGVQTIGGS